MNVSKEAYEQNYQQFRSLNQIMWQIPVLAMTLTGGLWFGVSTINDNAMLVTILLLTAVMGNIMLCGVLVRFRHVMGCYLDWLKSADAAGFVDASLMPEGATKLEVFCNKDKKVHTLFLFMLGWAAVCSVVVLAGFWNEKLGLIRLSSSNPSLKFYDEHALALADSYESVAFENAYPFLANTFAATTLPLAVLDIGAGTGRDAAWISANGHNVTAVEPSTSMLTIAQSLHPSDHINWVRDDLPQLERLETATNEFDFILLNAVWMHILPKDRAASFQRLKGLLRPDGSIFVSLRLGPVNADRGMFEISSAQFVLDAKEAGFDVTPRGDFEDLLGRAEVSWKIFELRQSS
ncbi:MAG: class I SAM-dependent methyltransferase [Paracoccaceae bacterium]